MDSIWNPSHKGFERHYSTSVRFKRSNGGKQWTNDLIQMKPQPI